MLAHGIVAQLRELNVVGQPLGGPVEHVVHEPLVQSLHSPAHAWLQQVLVDVPVCTQLPDRQSVPAAQPVWPLIRTHADVAEQTRLVLHVSCATLHTLPSVAKAVASEPAGQAVRQLDERHVWCATTVAVPQYVRSLVAAHAATPFWHTPIGVAVLYFSHTGPLKPFR